MFESAKEIISRNAQMRKLLEDTDKEFPQKDPTIKIKCPKCNGTDRASVLIAGDLYDDGTCDCYAPRPIPDKYRDSGACEHCGRYIMECDCDQTHPEAK